MNLLASFARRTRGIGVGDVVQSVSCDGCMASEHNVQWIGEVTGFTNARELGWSTNPGDGGRITGRVVVIHVIKEGNQDDRDVDFKDKYIVEVDTSLQRLGAHLWVWFR